MKLVVCVVSTSDLPNVLNAMTSAGFPATVVGSFGGFLNKENATILSGIDNARIGALVSLIGDNTSEKQEDTVTAVAHSGFKLPDSIRVGGAVIFVLPVEQFIKL